MDQPEKLELEAHRDQFAADVLGIGNRRFAEIGIAHTRRLSACWAQTLTTLIDA